MSDFLFAMPGFLEGMGRSIDLGATMEIYNSSDTPGEADLLALKSDWAATGQTMQDAVAETTKG